MDEPLIRTIQQNLGLALDTIERAKQSGGRTGHVQLVVVTKAQPLSVVEAAILAGATVLGENYPEETVEKAEAFHERYPQVRWHMIGHLQSRKTNLIVRYFDYFQSLDSSALAQKLERLLTDANKQIPVLFECNVSGEGTKGGWSAWNEKDWPALADELLQVAALPHLKPCGLMTMPPLFEDAEQVRPYFQRLARFLAYLQNKGFSSETFCQLSMGTSSDYEVAVQEGATFVRIGKAIVGPRPPRI